MPLPHPASPGQFVTFMVGGVYFAADIRGIREVVRTPEITRLPCPTKDVVGVANVRGRILPVADAGRCFELGVDSQASRMLVVDRDGEAFGLLVDSVEGVTGIESDMLRPVPSIWVDNALAISSMAQVGDRLIALVDVGEILSL
ncbi:MAG: chemotaxis protein CheW [Rhodothermales bacterium]